MELRGNAYFSLNQWDKAITDYSKAIDLDPKDGVIPANRGWVYAELGQWDKAASDYSKAVKLDPQRRFSWAGLAVVLLAKGDGEGYRRACASLIDRFGQTDDPQVADNVGWLCVQAPDAVAPREEVVRLAKQAVESAKDKVQEHLYLQTLGAATYRAGRFQEAIEHLNKGIKAHGKEGDAFDWLFLAMAHQRLGHSDEARKWLDRAVQWIDQSTRDHPKDDSLGTPIGWAPWMILKVLRREAESLMKAEKPGK